MKKLALIAISIFAVANMQAGKHKHCAGNPQAAVAALLAKHASASTSCKAKEEVLHDLRKICKAHPQVAVTAATALASIELKDCCTKHAKGQRKELAKIATIAIRKA